MTRDEDNIQADNLLAENFTKAVDARRRRTTGRSTCARWRAFEWDRVLLVQPGTPRGARSRERLGHEWTGIDTVDGGDLLIFLRTAKVVRFADYRGSNTFAGFERPFDEFAREEATFSVRDRVVRRLVEVRALRSVIGWGGGMLP